MRQNLFIGVRNLCKLTTALPKIPMSSNMFIGWRASIEWLYDSTNGNFGTGNSGERADRGQRRGGAELATINRARVLVRYGQREGVQYGQERGER